MAQARRFAAEVEDGVKRSLDPLDDALLLGLRKELETMVERVEQVRRQTKQRVFGGNVHAADKLLSVFEPTTEVIGKGKAGEPNEFGKMVKIQEAENQIVTSYEVYEQRPDDRAILLDAVAEHERRLGRRPRLVAADAGFSSAANERALEQRWFKCGQKWRTGCEGRISVLQRRHGLDRSL